MGSTTNQKSFSLTKRPDGVAILLIDVPGEAVNTLKATFVDDFNAAFDQIADDNDIKAVVLASGKKDNFIAGADIAMLEEAKTEEAGMEIARGGQQAMERIASSSKPVVAAIHGAALGGGLEVAMACHGRVASSHKKTKLGLPEVQLGVLPGASGTQRLPKLIGAQAALDLLLTGRQIDGRKAKKLGLVDEVVPAPIVVAVAAKRALALSKQKRDTGPMARVKEVLDQDVSDLALAENPLGRKILFDQARKKLLHKSRGNYPAPERILDVVRVGLAKGMKAGLEAERREFAKLIATPEAKSLMSIFFATTALKKDTGVADANVEAVAVRKVGVLGAGLMGAGIAYVTSAIGKIPVRLKDRDDNGVLAGLKYVRKELDGRVKRRRMTRTDADRIMSTVTGTTGYAGFNDAEVIIEAVFEDLDLKHRVLKEVEGATGDRTIFASNTSSLPITEIAKGAKRPENVIGMHYFSPVPKMPLLEIIATKKTAPWVTATCVALGKKQGKTVIVVNDGVGFYTSRILGPFMNEAAHILAEGVPIEKIDEALLDFGYPVGPIKLMDEVGIDVGAKVGKILVDAFGERLTPPGGIDKLLADGRHGRKNGKGFYLYGQKSKKREVDASVYGVLGVTPTAALDAHVIAERCALQMVNEAAHCFGEGILRSARDGDVGAIFGLGFPPYLGGPFRYVDALGAETVVDKLRRYRDTHGPRFEPAPVLETMASSGGTFHGKKPASPGKTRKTPAKRKAPAARAE